MNELLRLVQEIAGRQQESEGRLKSTETAIAKLIEEGNDARSEVGTMESKPPVDDDELSLEEAEELLEQQRMRVMKQRRSSAGRRASGNLLQSSKEQDTEDDSDDDDEILISQICLRATTGR